MMIKAFAWNIGIEKGFYHYRLQANDVCHKTLTKFTKLMKEKGWRESGIGFKQDNKMVLIFAKEFKSSGEWVKWAKKFPYDLTEIGKNDKEKKYIKKERKTKKKDVKKRRKAKKVVKKKKSLKFRRRCAICERYGHTKKTCERRKNA